MQLPIEYVIVALPPLLPVTVPRPGPPLTTLATPALLLVQIPPATISLSVIVCIWHTVPGPLNGDGVVLTVTVVVTTQPSEYVMVAVPGATPVTNPETGLTTATKVLPLVQTPPDVPSLNVSFWPTHNAPAPVIVDGSGFTVIIVVTVQPEPNE